MTRTAAAFDAFRQKHGPAKKPRAGLVRNAGEVAPMTPADELVQWVDGPVDQPPATPSPQPKIDDTMLGQTRLWAVRHEDVVHAHEYCKFGATLETGKIKHTNLTGGGDAFCAGELLFLSSSTIVVNGSSGRYGPATEAEMNDVALAFRQSGYHVWSSGFDDDTGRPYQFLGIDPVWVS